MKFRAGGDDIEGSFADVPSLTYTGGRVRAMREQEEER
jgi:hypothetical protein